MIALASVYPNVYLDTSAYLPRYYPKALLDFMNTTGREKVLFATNFPMLDFQKCVEQVGQLGLPPAVERAFLYDNARNVYGLD